MPKAYADFDPGTSAYDAGTFDLDIGKLTNQERYQLPQHCKLLAGLIYDSVVALGIANDNTAGSQVLIQSFWRHLCLPVQPKTEPVMPQVLYPNVKHSLTVKKHSTSCISEDHDFRT